MNATITMKKFTVAAFVALASLAARSEYLYWMIDQPDPEVDNYIGSFDYATVKMGDDVLYLYSAEGVELGTEVVPDGASMAEGAYALVSNYSGLPAETQFLFELWSDGSADRVGWASYTKGEIARYVVDSFNQMGGSPLAVTQPRLIPEPTSGILLLLGMAGLALRRRRLA